MASACFLSHPYDAIHYARPKLRRRHFRGFFWLPFEIRLQLRGEPLNYRAFETGSAHLVTLLFSFWDPEWGSAVDGNSWRFIKATLKVALAYSSKKGLLKEYRDAFKGEALAEKDAPADFFAEGDSPETLNAVMDALRQKGHEVHGVEADGNAPAKLAKLRPDMVFNIAEGLFGDFRESYIPMVCERLRLKYTGSAPLTLGLCLNKARCKEVLSYYGIPNASFKIFGPGDKIDFKGFEFPAIVKPNAEGSSKGIFDNSVVDDAKAATKLVKAKIAEYGQPVIVERFLEGDEFTVAMLGNGSEVEVLPIVAIRFDQLPKNARKIYSYEAKWIWDTSDKPLEIFKCPAKISAASRKAIEKLVISAKASLDIRDWCRMDVRMDAKGRPNILEINPLPGILPKPEDNSCFPKAARAAGYKYSDMLDKVLRVAERRQS